MQQFSFYFSVSMVLLCCTAAAGPAQNQLKETLDAVLAVVKDPALQGAEQKQTRLTRINEHLAKRFDYREMSMRSLGREWNRINESDRADFTNLFRKLLENTYLTNIDQLTNDTMLFDKEIKLSDDKYTIVTRAVTTDGREIPVEYNVMANGDRWLIYDVRIEGVSLVRNYRTQFSRTLQRKDFAALLDNLHKKINELEK